ncbi:NADH dehydrogenase [ubiquinone] 1 alpha subcomplex assembly factor 8 isoform X2 [Ursus maritimus]|uniref:NADH dehydrogenase [ubiquinone] 1 alpha subcomplex assembly factor 8 isoform X2 n=1 Tax=Ursus maritimus TaxID=29073 RepID=A0A8M1GMH9_URSMA|nr:NADH dehydrogenase [ubiquinone] 1 alpha subcomplex assembly factor 8 isoform X2 [Ursus maritimus]
MDLRWRRPWVPGGASHVGERSGVGARARPPPRLPRTPSGLWGRAAYGRCVQASTTPGGRLTKDLCAQEFEALRSCFAAAVDSDPRRIGCRASESLCISPAPAEVKNHSVWSKWVWRRCRHAQGTWMGVPGGMRRGLPAMQVLAWCPDPVGLGWAVTPVTRCVLRSCWCRELDSRLGSWVSSAAIREPEAIP